MKITSEAAFEMAIKEVLLVRDYVWLVSKELDAELAIFPDVALAFITFKNSLLVPCIEKIAF